MIHTNAMQRPVGADAKEQGNENDNSDDKDEDPLSDDEEDEGGEGDEMPGEWGRKERERNKVVISLIIQLYYLCLYN